MFPTLKPLLCGLNFSRPSDRETAMPQPSLKLAGFLLGLIFSVGILAAEPVVLNPAHPDRYVVVKGDTLWDIAGRFLRDPWRWPEVWHVNPQIENPHLIYPGDTIILTYVDGRPRLRLQRGPGSGVVKLSPRVRSTPLDTAIPVIPMDAIRPFLTRPYVLGQKDLDKAPYVVSFADEHIVAATDNRIYVRAIGTAEHNKYDVVRPGKPYRDADTDEILGYEALLIGSARLERTGDPATLYLLQTDLETQVGDRLLPVVQDTPQRNFAPKAPASDIRGNIIGVLNGVTQIGQHNVVVLDRGAEDGLQVGDVLAIDRRGETIPDPVTPDRFDEVTLPDEKAGTLMVFRTFPRVSFGLVMSATMAIHVLDRVHNP